MMKKFHNFSGKHHGRANETVCSIFGGEVSKCENFVTIQIALASLSIISCFAVILFTIVSGKYKVLTHRLVLYQAIASLLESICQIVNRRRKDDQICTFLGWFIHFTEMSLLMWVGCISIHAFLLVTKGNFLKKEYILHLLGWGLPFLVSVLPFFQMKYGPAGMWCWMKNDWAWRMATFYIPVYVLTFAMIVLCSYTIYYVHKMSKKAEDNEEEARKMKILKCEVHLLIIYPFIYLVLELVPLIHRIHNAVHKGKDTLNFSMVLLHGMSLSLRGFINAVVFIIANKNDLHIFKPKCTKEERHVNGEANLAFHDQADQQKIVDLQQQLPVLEEKSKDIDRQIEIIKQQIAIEELKRKRKNKEEVTRF